MFIKFNTPQSGGIVLRAQSVERLKKMHSKRLQIHPLQRKIHFLQFEILHVEETFTLGRGKSQYFPLFDSEIHFKEDLLFHSLE